MNSRRVLSLVKRDMKRMVREPASMMMILLFPIAFILVFGTCYGAIGGQTVSFKVGVVNMDALGPNHVWSEAFVQNMTATGVLQVNAYANNASAQADLSQGRVQAVLIIPEGFGAGCSAYSLYPGDQSRWTNASVHMYLDPGSSISTQAVPPLVDKALTSTVYGSDISSPRPIAIGTPSMVQVNRLTAFDYIAPGIFAFSSIFIIMVVAQSFAIDRESGTLRRISTTPLTPSEFMFGQVISNMVMASVQAAITFVLMFALGFHAAASTIGLLVGFFLVLVFSLCNVGLGLITATIAKSPGQATMISFAFIMPQMFLGTFVGASLSSLAQTAGRFVPSFYVTDGLTSIMLRGASLSSSAIVTDIAAVVICSLSALVVGIILFQKYGRV